uniref:Uncharacterized protein n=1 Tax=Peronospora matthiolae TaxID=2874970 RepID=A0AAV1T2T7_9STRA
MRNLNGYEINGRNLRVDFVDGKDKSGGSERKRHETGSHNGDSLEGPNANVTRLEANLDLGELLVATFGARAGTRRWGLERWRSMQSSRPSLGSDQSSCTTCWCS